MKFKAFIKNICQSTYRRQYQLKSTKNFQVRTVKDSWYQLNNNTFKRKQTKQGIEEKETMLIVGQVSSPEEAKEVEFIAKSFIVANRIRALALQLREV